MGLTSNTGLLATDRKTIIMRSKSPVQLQCDVAPAPFALRPLAGLYNPFSHRCSILCNHPADTGTRQVVKKAKAAWNTENKLNLTPEELAALKASFDNEKDRLAQDIVTEDMFRRYTDTDSRPLTPAPTLASGKSRGSRRCLTPDQPPRRTLIVLDLRRSHSQLLTTLHFLGGGSYQRGVGNSMHLGVSQTKVSDVVNEVVDILNDPVIYDRYVIFPGTEEDRRAVVRGYYRKFNVPGVLGCIDCTHVAMIKPSIGEHEERFYCRKRYHSRNVQINQLKALNLGKPAAQKKSKAAVAENGSGGGAGGGDQSARDEAGEAGEAGEARRRGRRRRKGRHSIDRLTSAGLAAGAAQDPETQIAGIGTDSHNASSRGSLAPAPDAADDAASVPGAPRGRASATAAAVTARRISSFLDDDILKFLHREVDQNAIETEFDTKRRYVLEEALRTRPERPLGREMQSLLQEMRGSGAGLGAGEAAGLADWLHIPRVFSRRSAQFTLPLDSAALQTLTPMQYAARYVTLKNSKQLLYLTVLQKLRPNSYKMPVRHISEGLTLMMGGTLKPEQAESFRRLMAWDVYEEQLNFSDDIKLTLARRDSLRSPEAGHGTGAEKTIKYRTWCGVCAVCERCYGRFHPRDKDPPDGMEQSDFSMLETKLASLNVDLGLVEILNIIRTR